MYNYFNFFLNRVLGGVFGYLDTWIPWIPPPNRTPTNVIFLKILHFSLALKKKILYLCKWNMIPLRMTLS